MRGMMFFVVLLVMFSCNPTKKTNNGIKGAPAKQALYLERKEGQSRITFLTLNVWLQDSIKDEYGFAQKTVMYAEGKVKRQEVFMGQYESYQLYWELRDAKKELIAAGNVPDPLYQSFETSEEHTGRMEKHLLHAKSGEIVLRFNLDADGKSLLIYKLSVGKLKKLYEANIL